MHKVALSERKRLTEKENDSLILFIKGRSVDQADTLVATPRNLVIGKDIADDCLDTNIFRDG